MTHLPEEPAARAALAAHAARLKHDLGKYVAMQQRWLGPEPEESALRDALASDVLATRRGPDGTVDAVAVWDEFRGVLFGSEELVEGYRVDLGGEPEVQVIERGMAALSRAVPDLRAGDLRGADLVAAHSAALEVSDACRALAARLGAWSRRKDG